MTLQHIITTGLFLGVLSLFIFFTGLLNLLSEGGVSIVTFFLLLLLLLFTLRANRPWTPQERSDQPDNHCLTNVLSVAIMVLWVVEILLLLTPPTAKDELIHHLAVPRLYVEKHGIFEIPYAMYSYYPMNLEMLYIIPILFGNDSVPRLIHFLFGMLTAGLIYLYLKERTGTLYSLVGALTFVSVPNVIYLSTVAYADLGLTFYTFAALVGLLKWHEENHALRWLIFSALSCGLAAGTKYNGLLVLFLLAIGAIYLQNKREADVLKVLKTGSLYLLLSLLVASPWLVKNYALTGNPTFPLFKSLWGGEGFDQRLSVFTHRAIFYHEDLKDFFLLPLKVFFSGKDGDPQYFDGVLTPLLITFLPFSFMRGADHEKTRFLSFFAFFYFAYVFFLTDLRIRYLMPIIPPLTVLATIGLKNLYENFTKARVATILCGIILMLANLSYLYNYFQKVQPLPYILGKETRDEYLMKHSDVYPMCLYVNTHLPADSKIMFVFMPYKGYYCHRDYYHDLYFQGDILRKIIEESNTDEDILAHLQQLKTTHLLMIRRLLVEDLSRTLPQGKWVLFQRFGKKHLIELAKEKGYHLYEVRG